MSKIIAVCGGPGSGKTTVALNIAKEIYSGKKTTVLFVSPDLTTPSLGFLFPNKKENELYSLGKALDCTDVCKENVLKQIVTPQKSENLGFLGYKAGEDKYTYPSPTRDKISALFRCMKQIADYVVVDCCNDSEDLISVMALSEAESVIRIVKPDIKTMAYYLSNMDRYAAIGDRTIGVINISERDAYLPVEDVKKHFETVRRILPYSIELKQQSLTGELAEKLQDSKYLAVIKDIVRDVL